MQPGAAPPQPDHRAFWIGPMVGAVVFLAAALIFFQMRDPVILGLGFAFAIVVAGMLRPYRWYRHAPWWYGAPQPAPQTVVKVKCAGCASLNDEQARFCSHCGKPL